MFMQIVQYEKTNKNKTYAGISTLFVASPSPQVFWNPFTSNYKWQVSTRILSSSEFTHTQPTSIHRTKVTREAAGKKNGIFLCTWKMLKNAHWAQCFPKTHQIPHLFRRPHALAPAPPCTSGGRGWPSPYCPTGRQGHSSRRLAAAKGRGLVNANFTAFVSIDLFFFLAISFPELYLSKNEWKVALK